MLSLKNVCKTVTNSKKQMVKVLSNVNLEVRQGDFVCIQGVNGSGKSAILNIIGARDMSFEGEYYIDGIELSRFTAKQLSALRLEKFGFVPEMIDLFDKLTVAENVGIALKWAKIKRQNREKMVENALSSVGLAPAIAKLKPQELSAGQMQRVMIARAIVLEPKVLLIDNPTLRLDDESGQMILNLLNRLNKDGVTVVVVSNDERYLFKAKRVFTVSRGMVVENLKVTRGKNMGEVIGIDEKVQEKRSSGVRKTVVAQAKTSNSASGLSIGEALALKEEQEKEEKAELLRKKKEKEEQEKKSGQQLQIAGIIGEDTGKQVKPVKTTKSAQKTTSKSAKNEKTASEENSEFMIQPVKSGKKKAGK